ncbi:MAG TPA: hypothetical protein VLN57_21165 [Xanthobacteraceae bacterium]|nr:hypothetical protein [Xanthobacteraceae bacterium]
MSTDVTFTTNPSDYQKLEGLYVAERGPTGFIRAADLSTTGLAARCVRGPDAPQVITNVGRFLDIYGARDFGAGGAVIGQAWAALLNKAFGTLVIQRVRASDAVAASFTLETAAGGAGTAVLRVDASSVGLWGNNVSVNVSAATDANANHFNLTAQYLGKQFVFPNIDISATNVDNTALVIGSDVATVITLTKLANGRPVNTTASTDGADANAFIALGQTAIAGFTGVAGTEGTLAVTDYNAGVNTLAAFPGVSVVLVPEIVAGSAATFHSNLVTLSSTVADRIFLTWAQAHGQSVSTEVTQVGTQITTRTDRIVWCYNSPFTIDPSTSQELQQGPHVWLGSILSQVDVDIHAGSFQTQALLAGCTRVTNTSLTRGDLIALKNAGISTLERLKNGFQFRSAVTTSLTPGKTELARRRMADFLQLSAADRLVTYVKGKNVPETRALMGSELTAFSVGLQVAGRVIAKDDPTAGKGFSVDQVTGNTPAQRAQGEEHILWRVRLIGHMLALVFDTDISTGTVVQTQ